MAVNRSPVAQYLSWLGVLRLFKGDERPGLLQGDLGLSIKYNQPVSRVISSRLPATLYLNLITIVFTWVIAIPLGIWAAVRQYKWPDRILSAMSFAGMSMPSFLWRCCCCGFSAADWAGCRRGDCKVWIMIRCRLGRG